MKIVNETHDKMTIIKPVDWSEIEKELSWYWKLNWHRGLIYASR